MADHSDQKSRADLVRRHDRDRWLTAQLAPAPERGALIALYALNVELSRIPETVREPMAGLIRLQWWREGLERAAAGAAVPDHPVLNGIAPLAASGLLPPAALAAALDARESELQDTTPADLAAFEATCRSTGGTLCRLAARLLAVEEEAGLRAAAEVGTAHGMIAGLLNAPWWAARGRTTIPGGGPETGQAIARRAEALLAAARAVRERVPRAALPALVIGRITDSRIRRLAGCGFDPAAPMAEALPLSRPLAILKGALTGRY
jgi:phytoene synthase